MKFTGKITKRGITIKRFNFILCIVAVIISITMFIAMNLTARLYNKTHTITRNMVSWIDSSYELQLASDYLTEQMRCFVISGDRKYLDNYFEEAKVTKRRDNALEALGNAYGKVDAYTELSEAMEESVDLMNVEYYAARLAVEGYGYSVSEYPEEIQAVILTDGDEAISKRSQIDKAESLLFDSNYRNKKETISSHMRDCISELVDGFSENQAQVSSRLREQVLWEHILTFLLIVILLLSVIIVSSQVLHPLRKSVEYIRKDEPIPLKGAYELRFLAKTYNLMSQVNREKKEKLAFEASHDELTGLYNRRGYEFLLENLDMETSAILMVDLDEFKSINDSYGHDIGDRILIKVSDLLKKYFKNNAFICRLGGDEFVVIMTHTDQSQKNHIRQMVIRINEKLNKPKNNLPVTSISAGGAFGAPGKDVDVLFKEADTALYMVKNNGRCDIEFC